MRVLHLGSGRKGQTLETEGDVEVVTLDADARLNPNLVCTLGQQSIPLPDDSVDVIIAVHVLEHIGRQGDVTEWFYFWEDLYRVLVPNGQCHFESPWYNSVWAWGDPSHTRVLSPESFLFFSQDSYRIPESPISPYRINCDFVCNAEFKVNVDPRLKERESITGFSGTLIARKPLKPWWKD